MSSDDDHRSILDNKEIQNCLEKGQQKNVRFDIVAYYACLMAMVETAYSLRKVTDFLAASQELKLGAGWDHALVLKKHADNPGADP
ncbi:clostripain-related cysteine peptidase [Janthinobacterium sp. Ant5-2-1]|uniref:clostripain-related cysteine peptidase n=1 Tax=Janthinobacterium sp. Ant5-2-1 TaxID=1755239 RepID=UPI00137ADD53|nr:clostripain-related cysteine peptidase [Janthinobacterium sp. Ant5-2-1]